MADDVTVRVEGLSRLRRGLRDVGENVDDLKDANKRAGEVVLRATHPPHKSGRLGASGRTSRAAGRVSILYGGARLPYGGPVHWGWPARGIEANPFVVDAAQRTEAVWLPMYQADLDDLIGRVKGA